MRGGCSDLGPAHSAAHGQSDEARGAPGSYRARPGNAEAEIEAIAFINRGTARLTDLRAGLISAFEMTGFDPAGTGTAPERQPTYADFAVIAPTRAARAGRRFQI